MDVVYLVGATVMFVALLGMVMGCDKLGVRK
jgi:hypothetical protein